MSEWLIFAGYLVIALTAWSLDGNARGTAEDARLKAFVDQDRRSAVVEPDAVERLGPLALGSLSGRDHRGGGETGGGGQAGDRWAAAPDVAR
jgi:hypothetical protein